MKKQILVSIQLLRSTKIKAKRSLSFHQKELVTFLKFQKIIEVMMRSANSASRSAQKLYGIYKTIESVTNLKPSLSQYGLDEESLEESKTETKF